VWYKEAFHRLGVQDVTEFDSVFCFFGERKKKIRETTSFFFPGTRLALLAVPHLMFTVVFEFYLHLM
jgi:hypothetical protein